MANSPYRVFYSYSHADIRHLQRLRKHMAMLRRQGLIAEWYDRDIDAGSEWRQEIERELEAADVILLLVSADFLASDFCYEQEMQRAVERGRDGDAIVIGVMLRPVDGWDNTPFAEFQLVPRDARPISRWSDKDEAYRDVVERIREVLEDLAPPPSPGASDVQARPDGLPDSATPDDELLTPMELEMLAQISDPEQRRLQREQIVAQRREDMLRAVSQNFRV